MANTTLLSPTQPEVKNDQKENSNEEKQIDDLELLSYIMLHTTEDWFTPEQISKEKNNLSVDNVSKWLMKAFKYGFFEFVKKDGTYQFKKVVRFTAAQ